MVHCPLSVVMAPGNAPGTRNEYHQKVELEQACLAEAGQRFTQAGNTPLLNPPLIKIFGELGNPKEVAKVLEGTFSPPLQCDIYVAKFLLVTFRPLEIKDTLVISEATYCQGWRKAQEETSSSAPGIHFGHYIAGTFNPEILIINATMANIPLHTGFAYERWKKGMNVMIEKTTGDFNVEKLRIILLFEADFNANNKWIGCTVMFQAERSHLLANKQYGSHKHKLAIHQCLNKNLFYNLVCFKQQPAALCSNDAKSCYNCIVLLVAALCLCHLGASQQSVFSMLSTIHQMEHHIRTTYGSSSKSGSMSVI